MTIEEEALKYLKENVCYKIDVCNDGFCKDDCAIEVAISALEKQIPKKPIDITIMGEVRCPACQKWIGSNQVDDFCLHCGQAFDFSEGEEA